MSKHRLSLSAIIIPLIAALIRPSIALANASLFYAPSKSTVTIGETFTVKVMISSAANTSSFNFSAQYPQEFLQALTVKCSNLFAMEIYPTIASGTVSDSCASMPPNPQSGSSIHAATITFKALKEGSATLSFGASTIVRYEPPQDNLYQGGTNTTITIKKAAPAATLTPTPTPAANHQPPPSASRLPPPATPTSSGTPVITSSTHPDQSAWYNQKQVQVQWTGQASGYNVAIDQNPATQLAEKISQTTTTYQQTLAGDGQWYAHVRAQTTSGWSGTAHYRLQIDTTAPSQPTLTMAPQGQISVKPTFTFSASDASGSPLTYQLQFSGQSDWIQVSSPYKPQQITTGPQTVILKATDAAGNSSQTSLDFTVSPIDAPTITHPATSHYGPFEVAGQAQPGALVEIYINDQLVETVTADQQGHFQGTKTYYHDDRYTVAAKAVNQDGIASLPSDPVTVYVKGYIAAFGLVVPNWLGYVMYGLTLLLLLGTIAFLVFKLRQLKRSRTVIPESFQEQLEKVIDQANIPDAALATKLKQELAEEIQEELADPDSSPQSTITKPSFKDKLRAVLPKPKNNQPTEDITDEANEQKTQPAPTPTPTPTPDSPPSAPTPAPTPEVQAPTMAPTLPAPQPPAPAPPPSTVNQPPLPPASSPPLPAAPAAPQPVPVDTVPTDAFDAVIAAEKDLS